MYNGILTDSGGTSVQRSHDWSVAQVKVDKKALCKVTGSVESEFHRIVTDMAVGGNRLVEHPGERRVHKGLRAVLETTGEVPR